MRQPPRARPTAALPADLPVGEVRCLTLDLGGLELAADVAYGLTIGFVGGEHVKDARLELLHADGDAYPGGVSFASAGAVVTPLGNDLVFYLHSTLIFADGFESAETAAWSATVQ